MGLYPPQEDLFGAFRLFCIVFGAVMLPERVTRYCRNEFDGNSTP